MHEKFTKPYDPKSTEDDIYKKWEQSGYFNPDICIKDGIIDTESMPFSIVLPPPNVTGNLHMGSALMLAIEDIMVRHARMKGLKTLWIPGTDHAAIATQTKVEKILEKEGLRRKEMGREKFLKRVNEFAKESHDTITHQMKKMGCSVDWSREAFTLDEKRNIAVKTAFKKMFDDGLIYQGHKIVNWDPKGQTTISDDEIEYKEEKTKFYYFKYGPFTIGTSRPETKFGDKYVVMHPEDKRYKAYKHGQKIDLEWINGPITATVIKDEAIDMAFGTGVMTITPWHSVVDFEIAERHNLDKEQIIDQYGKLLPIAGEFSGMKITEARPKIIEKLKAKNLLVKEEDYIHNVATAQRSGGMIEPQILKQWFVNVSKEFKYTHDTPIGKVKKGKTTSLKELMREAVESEMIKVLPDRFLKVYYHWIDNLHDWCISRQIWYGHQIPVWYRNETKLRDPKSQNPNSHEEIYIGIDKPNGEGWIQDEDTLDTWFSSGLWTFSTLGWPENTNDFNTYHPTTVLETGYDIIFFWVARMILMSTYLIGQVPFKTVYLHGLVRDNQNKKISKSMGNNIDPVEMIEQYGADAVRMSLIIGTSPGNDSKISPEKLKAYKHFANKIWNAGRFVLENTHGIEDDEKTPNKSPFKEHENKFSEIIKEVSKDMDNYAFYLAGEKLYHYFWHEFADIVIEDMKKIIKEGGENSIDAKRLLRKIYFKSLKALHPFMPFVTEEIWNLSNHKSMLMVESWPQ